MPPRRYLLRHRSPSTRAPSQLLERDGLRVRRAGDLQTRENQSGLRIRLLTPSLPRSGPTAGRGPGAMGERKPPTPPRATPLLLQPEEEAAEEAALGGRHAHSCVCPAQSQIPAEKGTPCREGAQGTHLGGPNALGLWKPPQDALPRPSEVYSRAVLRFCLTSELTSVC